MINNKIKPVSSSSVLKEFVNKALDFKWFYIISVVTLLMITFVLNKFSNIVYEVNASVLVNDDDERTVLVNSNDLFKSGTQILRNNKNIENELGMMSSFSLVSSAITNLNLEVGYFAETGKLIKQYTELYDASPFRVDVDKSHTQPIDVKFYVEILSDSTYRITAHEKKGNLYNYLDNEVKAKEIPVNITGVFKFNQPTNQKLFNFSVSLNKNNLPDSADAKKVKFYFQLYHQDFLAMQYLSRLKLEAASPLGLIINISYTGENLRKITTFLNKYIELYLNANLEKKNTISVSTIKFIDSQISQVSDSLVTSESNLREYRQANQVTDLSFQGQRIFDQMSQIETERANLLVQKRYYDYILDYFKKNPDKADVVPPSSMNVVDPILNQLITELITTSTERANIAGSEKNLFLNELNNKIQKQKEVISENVKNNLNTLNLSINELNYRYNKLSGDISRLPRTEIKMVGMERKYKLNDAIYTFLLQKRAEAEIARESNLPDYEILNPAREITSSVVAPKKSINLLVALFLGLLIPTGFILIKDFFNDKITNVFEVENITKHKLIGYIYKNRHKSEAVVAERPRSSVTESFRLLRTNLFIKMKAHQSHVVLVTSSMPLEGKSFVSFNLASSIASIGYKTLVIDFDLRRPTLQNKFNVDNSIGLSHFMISKALVDDIIIKSSIPNLYFIPAGPVLPNPVELLESGICDKLFNYLKLNFDYIVIDTPPLGAVADSYLLMKYTNQVLLVARWNYTKKDILTNTISDLEGNKMFDYEIVFNDINYKKSRFGQYYSNYYNEEIKQNNNNGISRILSKGFKAVKNISNV